MEVFPTTERIEVYLNPRGDVVIKQGDNDDESFVYIPRMHLAKVIKAMRQASLGWSGPDA